jgi:hypothetical protein
MISTRPRSLNRWVRMTLFVLPFLLAGSPASAMKDVFYRTKPHVNVGTYAGQPATFWINGAAGLFADGEAHGTLLLKVLGGETFHYQVIAGAADVSGDTVLGLTLLLLRVGPDGSPTGELDMVVIRRDPSNADCLIYDFVGPNVHLEAPGSLEVANAARVR